MVNIKKFVTEVKTEMKKVSWSTREDLITSTIVVLSSVALQTNVMFSDVDDTFPFTGETSETSGATEAETFGKKSNNKTKVNSHLRLIID